MPYFWDSIMRQSSYTSYSVHTMGDMIFATIVEFFIAIAIGYGIRNGSNDNKPDYKFAIVVACGLFFWMQIATWVHFGR